MSYWIVTDAGSDLPLSYVQQQEKLKVIPMPYRLDDKEYRLGAVEEASIASFYKRLNEGGMATTSQVTTADYVTLFREHAARGESLLCLSMSSGISGSFQSAMIARQMVMEEYPTAQIQVVDSLGASLGQGLLVHYALQGRSQGKTLDELAQWVTDNRQKMISWFTVDDLNFLFRGGRVTRTSALLGSMLRIKPVLHVNPEGKLIPKDKVQGRKRSLRELADKAIEYANPKKGQTMFISHGDCEADAQLVAKHIKEALPDTEFMISPIGAVIGSHSGPGTVALFFMGDHR